MDFRTSRKGNENWFEKSGGETTVFDLADKNNFSFEPVKIEGYRNRDSANIQMLSTLARVTAHKVFLEHLKL